MAARTPLTLAEKEWLYAEKVRGRSLSAIAAELGCSHETARKWWRLARDHGRAADDAAYLFPGQAAPASRAGDIKGLTGQDGGANRIADGANTGAMVISKWDCLLTIELPAFMDGCRRYRRSGWAGRVAAPCHQLGTGRMKQDCQSAATG